MTDATRMGLLAALTTVALWSVGCPTDAGPTCQRECQNGLVCKRVEDQFVQGSFREVCVPPSDACSPPCSADETCQNGQCVSGCDPACPDYEVCEAGGCVIPSYGLGCSQILTCITDCTKGDSACITRCEDGGNAIGGNLYAAFERCLEDNGCVDDACLNAHCLNHYRACQGLPTICDPPCQSGFTCNNAVCVPTGGGNCDPPCPAGQSCVDGQCRLGGGGCGAGQNSTVCVGNVLITCTNGNESNLDCRLLDPQCGCAEIVGQNRSDCVCGPGGGGQPCDPPCPFGTTCINGMCE